MTDNMNFDMQGTSLLADASLPGGWKAGRNALSVPLTYEFIQFLANSAAEVQKAWDASEKKLSQFLILLHEAGWESEDTKWAARSGRIMEFTNRTKSYTIDETNQLRLQVSFSSKNELSFRLHPWYR